MKKNFTIGIIGNGRLGRLFADTFPRYSKYYTVKVYARHQTIDNKYFFDIATVCRCDLVIPCVPISAMQGVLQQISTLIAKKTVIMDVCSVKVLPVQWMKKYIKKNGIIASHPIFGPDSSQNGLNFKGLKFVMYNISAPTSIYTFITTFWKDLGVNILEMSPKKHDKYAAYSINYNHLIGRVSEIIGIRNTPIDTQGFKVICNAMNYVVNDTWELFQDMQDYNPYAKKMRTDVLSALRKIESKLK